jgi:hypothetical protein
MRKMARKALCALIILFFSITGLYAANSKNIKLNIQGSGSNELVEGFKYALKIEATAAGYDVTDNMVEAKYIIKFTVAFDQIQQKSKFNVSLIKVADSSEIVAMEYLFTDEEEMLLYSQLVFFMLMANLPEDETGSGVVDDTWRNKWMYVRASIDYSIMLLALVKSDKLVGGYGAYNSIDEEDIKHPTAVVPLDNKVVPMPGLSIGAEVQFLNFMSAEPGVQVFYENAAKGYSTLNMLFSMQLKFPLKIFSGFVPAPYLMAAYPMRFSLEKEIFAQYPTLLFGGGLQAAVKMEKNSALFFEANYMMSFGSLGETNLNNQLAKYDPPLAPYPKTINYNYSAVCFKIGYKYGFFDRKR